MRKSAASLIGAAIGGAIVCGTYTAMGPIGPIVLASAISAVTTSARICEEIAEVTENINIEIGELSPLLA